MALATVASTPSMASGSRRSLGDGGLDEPRPRAVLYRHLDAAHIDLKAFTEDLSMTLFALVSSTEASVEPLIGGRNAPIAERAPEQLLLEAFGRRTSQ
jgi:hypothetical protein